MNFKQYYVIRERKFFTDLYSLIDMVLNNLKDKIEEKGGVKPGQIFTVPLGDYYDLDIKFYKGYSRAAIEYAKKEKIALNFSGLYFPEKKESNGRIEVYINTSKKNNNYYKERQFEDFVNKSLPKYIKNILTHEITHAYEDIVKDVLKFKKSQTSSDDAYYNSDEEMNAFLTETMHDILNTDHPMSQTIHFYIRNNKIKEASRDVFGELIKKNWIKKLNRNNKIRIIKLVYRILSDLAQKQSKQFYKKTLDNVMGSGRIPDEDSPNTAQQNKEK